MTAGAQAVFFVSEAVHGYGVMTHARKTMREPAATCTKVERAEGARPGRRQSVALQIPEALPPEVPLGCVRVARGHRGQAAVVLGRRGPVAFLSTHVAILMKKRREPFGSPGAVAVLQAAGRAFDRATNPLVTRVAHERPGLFDGWTADDWDELYSQFGVGGALTEQGVHVAAARINGNRDTVYRLRIVLQTHLADVAAGLIDTLYRQVCIGAEDGAGPRGRDEPSANGETPYCD